jgi:hypothetical protein
VRLTDAHDFASSHTHTNTNPSTDTHTDPCFANTESCFTNTNANHHAYSNCNTQFNSGGTGHQSLDSDAGADR